MSIQVLQPDVPGAPQEVTRIYFSDGAEFGHRHARPATSPTADRTWDDEQLLDAAHVGAQGRDLHPDLLAALCQRYMDFVQGEATRAEALLKMQIRAELAERKAALIDRELCAERSERNRLAGLNAGLSNELATVGKQLGQVRFENIHLRHQVNGTTPVSVQMAVEDDMDADTVVVDVGGGR